MILGYAVIAVPTGIVSVEMAQTNGLLVCSSCSYPEKDISSNYCKKMRNSTQEVADYYYNEEGYLVFTEAFHLKRGKCCGNKCLHCPYDHINVKNC
jgi:outer membrane usher protein FimD/PapC